MHESCDFKASALNPTVSPIQSEDSDVEVGITTRGTGTKLIPVTLYQILVLFNCSLQSLKLRSSQNHQDKRIHARMKRTHDMSLFRD